MGMERCEVMRESASAKMYQQVSNSAGAYGGQRVSASAANGGNGGGAGGL